MDTGDGRDDTCGCKVGRDIRAYGLGGLDVELERRREEGTSLRDLADFVNARIVAAEVDAADIAGDPASVYAALTDEDVPLERRTETRDLLAYAGVDVDALRADFVSHQTVRDHLRTCLGIDTSRDAASTLDEGRQIVEWSRRRDEEVIARTLDRLRRVGELATGPLDVTPAVTATCEDCGESYRVEELLDRGACECGGEGALPPED